MLAGRRPEPLPGNARVRPIIVGLLLIMAAAACGKTHPEQEQSIIPGETVPATRGIEVTGTDTLTAPVTGAVTPTQRLPRLLDLGATTCIPCKLMAPILEELREEYRGRMEVTFIDVRKDPEAARQHKIQVIPTQIFYDASGTELSRHTGFISKEDILATWEKLGIRLG
jgi:thioredoxin 1